VKPCVGTWVIAAARMAVSVGLKGAGGGEEGV